jgi:hypothetical protein
MENTSAAQAQSSQKGEDIQSTIEEVEEEIEEGERT